MNDETRLPDISSPPAPTAMTASVSAPPSLAGLRLFVVEDDAVVAMILEANLADLGCVIVDLAVSVQDALRRLVDTVADVALLDVNLGGETAFPVADALAERGIPLVFATGYGSAGLEGPYRTAPVLTKPYSLDDLADALSAIARGTAS
ncbi:MAG TPA: response regulator [Caulobacteraceae bacterium]|nr:response regulator [Caulobacteraceae bacterium]